MSKLTTTQIAAKKDVAWDVLTALAASGGAITYAKLSEAVGLGDEYARSATLPAPHTRLLLAGQATSTNGTDG